MQQQTKKPKTKKIPKNQKPKNQKQKTENYDVEISSICQDARDLDIIVFCFGFCFWFFGFWFFGIFFWFFLVCCCILYSTSLSSYVQPDDGHHYGRNM